MIQSANVETSMLRSLSGALKCPDPFKNLRGNIELASPATPHRILHHRFGQNFPPDQQIDRFGYAATSKLRNFNDIRQGKTLMSLVHIVEHTHHPDLLQARLSRLAFKGMIQNFAQDEGCEGDAAPLGVDCSWHTLTAL